MSDLLIYLAVMNLFAAAAVAVVMALRLPVRRLFGARVAYGLWALTPLPALALLLPARVVRLEAPPPAPVDLSIPPAALAQPELAAQLPPGPDLVALAGLAWAVGCVASLAWFAWRQHQFARAARQGRAGPAVIGVLRPRIVTPDDFSGLYTDREQQVVLAHERTHIARRDIWTNALVALARCLCWFNPAIHLLAHYLRVDQELACDAQVIAAHPQARRSYAEAMLKTQLVSRPLPLGCYWLAEGVHPLAARIRLLGRPDPGRARRRIGTSMVALLALGAVGSAWAAKPAQVVTVASAAALPAPKSMAAPAPAPALAAAPKPSPAKAAAVRESPAPNPAPAPEAIAAKAVAVAEADAAPPPLPQAEPDARARGAAARAGYAEARVDARARASATPLIAPGHAVRVVASTVAPDGMTLSNDITSYSSNPLYRSGSYKRGGSAYGLYTTVFQRGDRFWVTASVMHQRQPLVSGTVALANGESGQLELANGQVVSVTATQRPETAEETQAVERARRPAVYGADTAMAAYRSRARTPRAE